MDSIEMRADGHLEFRRVLSAPIDVVWKFLTEDELRGKWLCRGDVETREGGVIEFKFDPEQLGDARPEGTPEGRYTADFAGTVTTYDPPNRLAFLWPGETPETETRVSMTLTPLGEGTELHLVHDRIATKRDRVGSAAGWHAHLERLECHLSRSLAPNFYERHDELEADYRRMFAEARA